MNQADTRAAKQGRGVRAAWAALALAFALAMPAAAQTGNALYSADFENADVLQQWSLSGDWRVRENSPCLPNVNGFVSPSKALAYDYATACAYRNNQFGYATSLVNIAVPITLSSVRLEWQDFVAAEVGADFYFVQISTDGGATWPFEVYRDSKDELFWDRETVDISSFAGKTIRIRFGFTTDDSITNLGWYIDDVRVIGEPLAAGVSAIAIAPGSAVEGNASTTPLKFNLTIDPVNPLPITVEYATVNGTAFAGLDYVAQSSAVTIPANTATFPITIQVKGDPFFEPTETFTVVLSNPTANAIITIPSATGSILDDDPLVQAFPEPPRRGPEGFETPEGTFPWSVGFPGLQPPTDPDCSPSTLNPLCDLQLWHIQSLSGCVTPGFQSPSRALVFNNEATCTYDTPAGVEGLVRLTDGIRLEDNQVLSAQLRFKHFLEINYSAIQPEVTTAYVEISNNGINGPYETVATFAPTAPSTDLFVLPWQDVSIPLNQYIGDDIFIQFRFKQPVESNRHNARGWYIDDVLVEVAARPANVSKVRIQDASALEGITSSSNLPFQIDVVPANTSAIQLQFATELLNEPNAADVSDFSETSQNVVIPVGTSSTTNVIRVPVLGDDEPEPDEVFGITVTGISANVFLVNAEAIGTILNDDTPSTLGVSIVGATVPTEVSETAGTVTVRVQLSTPRSRNITLEYRTQDGTAVAGPGLDYARIRGGTLTIPANTTTATFPLTIQNDTQFEGDETFNLVFTSDSAFVTPTTVAAITIKDDETGIPPGASNLTIDSPTITEGSCPNVSAEAPCGTLNTVTFTVTLATPNAGDISVEYETEDLTTNGTSDYTPVRSVLTIPAGDTSATIDVDITADRLVEAGGERFDLVLFNPQGNVNIVENRGEATISDDDFLGVAFGVLSADIYQRPLDSATETDEDLLGGVLTPTALDFRSFNFDALYGFNNNRVVRVDLASRTFSTIANLSGSVPNPGEAWTGLAWDSTTGSAVAVANTGLVAEVDLDTGTIVQSFPLTPAFLCVAVHPTTGRVYAVAAGAGQTAELYRIDRAFGAWSATLLGTLDGVARGLPTDDALWDADFDAGTNAFYLNAYEDDGVGGSKLVTRIIDIGSLDGGVFDTRIVLEGGTTSSLAIATTPTPQDVLWTADYAFDGAQPLAAEITTGDNDTFIADALKGIGDINGDTIEDFAVTQPGYDTAALADVGRILVFYGGDSATMKNVLDRLRGDLDLSVAGLLDGSNGFQIIGATAGQGLGSSVSGIGFFNNDRYADLVIGFVQTSGAQCGGAYIVYGANNLPSQFSTANIGDPANKTVSGVIINAACNNGGGDEAGSLVAGAGDFTGNGYNDVLIGAPGWNGDRGAAYLIFGSANGTGSSRIINLASLAPTTGIRILGEAPGDQFGTSGGGVGDFNGDGVDDVAIGAPGAGGDDGSVFVLFGNVDYAQSTAPNPLNLARLSDSPGGIVPDSLLLTVKMPAPGKLAAFVFPEFVTSTNPGDLGKLPAIRLSGEGAGLLGTSLAGLGDVNGDGLGDFIAGAPSYDGSLNPDEPHFGRGYLIFGAPGEEHAPESLAANTGGSVPGVLLEGPLPGTGAFTALGAAGDVNGDGLMDALIGAPSATPEGYSGQAYVLYGANQFQARLSLRDLGTSADAKQRGAFYYNTIAQADFGKSLAAIGDINSDKISDFAIGKDGGPLAILGTQEQDTATYRVRTRSTSSALSNVPGGGGLPLGDDASRYVGTTGDGALSQPLSGVRIGYTGGGTGENTSNPSTENVTIFRKPAPDIPVGRGAIDDNKWIPAGVHWLIQTNRQKFSNSILELYYSESDVAGLNPNQLAVFYAKPNQTLSAGTAWTQLQFIPDPANRRFIIARSHNEALAQQDFNGYYQIVQTRLIAELGTAIPPVGVTQDKATKPIVVPDNAAYWHPTTKRLYAIRAVPIMTITWNNEFNQAAATVEIETVWPETSTGKFQDYVINTPPVDLTNGNGTLQLKSARLVDKDGRVDVLNEQNVPVTSSLASQTQPVYLTDLAFRASFNSQQSEDTRVLLQLSDDQNEDNGDIYYQFVRVKAYTDVLVSPSGGEPHEIGLQIDATTDPQRYGAFHDESAGAPFLLFANTPYAPYDPTRYTGFYNRSARTGTIVPINAKRPSESPFVLVFYKRGTSLVEGLTGNFVENPATQLPLPVNAWPYRSSLYSLQWPTPTADNTIIVARQNGSGELDVATYGSQLDIYVQNNSNAPGYNPNEEHAFIAPLGGGNAVFALRDDLSTTNINSADYTSQPYAFLTYFDPNDVVDGQPRAKTKPFFVTDTGSGFVFQPSASVPFANDPYEGEVPAFVNPPYPLSLGLYYPQNTNDPESTKFIFKDRTGRDWTKSATASTEFIDMRFYYGSRDDFFYPAAYMAKLKTLGDVYKTIDTDGDGDTDLDYRLASNATRIPTDFPVPFLDDVANPSSLSALTGKPREVRYQVRWPQEVASIGLGEIVLEAKFGVPQINGQCSVEVVYDQTVVTSGDPNKRTVDLIDPIRTRSVPLSSDDFFKLGLNTAPAGGELTFPDLPPLTGFRLSYDPSAERLKWKGIVVDPLTGFDYVLLNVIGDNPAASEKALIRGLSNNAAWTAAVDALAAAAADIYTITPANKNVPVEALALSTGNSKGTGYVTIAFQNGSLCDPLPVSVKVIRVDDRLNAGGIAVVNPRCVFDEKLTLTQTIEYGGKPQEFEFEWYYLQDANGRVPAVPNLANPTDPWQAPPLLTPSRGIGINSIDITGPGILSLTDNWFTVRYRQKNGAAPWGNRWSDFSQPQLAEGWIKRVVGQINPFDQRASGGGIAGAEASFASFGEAKPNTIVSMISQAGPRFTGSIPLNCDNLDGFGLIPIYQTVANRGADLSINSLSPIDNPGVNNALLLVASRLNDLYTLLANEAYADAQDPTVGFGTDDGTYGAQATSIHAFMNQTTSLLDEELALLRGRDNTFAPPVTTDPIYNRLIWNFTRDITGGEVAYALNYNILDLPDGGDGDISEVDAKRLYPQGHGDAWGHYLTAQKFYYDLLRNPFFTWVNRSEAVLVGNAATTVDYIDERKFARTAGAKAQAGAEIVNLTYRDVYVENPDAQWQGYADTDTDRAWGLSEWASRAGQGAYLDWVVGNAILRANDPDPDDTGISKIDRTTVPDLWDIPSAYLSIESRMDEADTGLNPLGVAGNAVPFDISPSEIDEGLTHFEQIWQRAVQALDNAETAFNLANANTQLLRQQADSQQDFQRGVEATEAEFNARLIELFGYPYSDDIGPGGTYATGYQGPDIFHYMYNDEPGVTRDRQFNDIYLNPPAATVSALETTLASSGLSVGSGNDLRLLVPVTTYGAVATCNPQAPAGGENATQVCASKPGTVVPTTPVVIEFNIANLDNVIGIAKPSNWTGQRRAPGEIQLARSEVIQQLGALVSTLDDYAGFLGEVDDQLERIRESYGLRADQITLLSNRASARRTAQDITLGLKTAQAATRLVADIVKGAIVAGKESVPEVTGIIIGFSNGIIFDTLAPVRGGLKSAEFVIDLVKQTVVDAIDLGLLRIEQEGARKDDQLSIDTADLEGRVANFESLLALESLLRNEVPNRVALYNAQEALMQSIGRYKSVLADAERTLVRLDVFRRQTAADVKEQRYKDMGFRLFREEALRKYRSQYDLAARYTFLAAKAYDYETTLISEDPRSGAKFLTDIVGTRQLGPTNDGLPQTGVGLANALAVMDRNFSVLRGQLGFNNPQQETNRFSLRHELFRIAPGSTGDTAWRQVLSQDYFTNGVGRVDNLNDIPEFRRLCVAPSGFGAVEPGIVIPFETTIEEGLNFFGQPLGGLDNAYDSTKFATKVRSVGVWFSNYVFLNLSNTPRVWLVPAGIDTLLSPVGEGGTLRRRFSVADQVLPLPLPIGANDLLRSDYIPIFDSLSTNFVPIRKFDRLRAYHDSGEFDIDEVSRNSRLIGRSVWNSQWMLFIPASTLGSNRTQALDTFINGISDIKLFFETYSYPRIKAQPGAEKN